MGNLTEARRAPTAGGPLDNHTVHWRVLINNKMLIPRSLVHKLVQVVRHRQLVERLLRLLGAGAGQVLLQHSRRSAHSRDLRWGAVR